MLLLSRLCDKYNSHAFQPLDKGGVPYTAHFAVPYLGEYMSKTAGSELIDGWGIAPRRIPDAAQAQELALG